MVAYYITYTIRNKDKSMEINIDAKNITSAKKKIGKKHGYKDGRMIQIVRSSVIGYY